MLSYKEIVKFWFDKLKFETIIATVFSVLILRRLQVAHLLNSISSLLQESTTSVADLFRNESVVSSAYRIGETEFEKLGKSFMYNKNKIGPRIEPCGTPTDIVLKLDKLSPTLTA